MSIVIGPQPVKHNIYTLEDFLGHDAEKGAILTRNAQRTFYASEDFIVGLQAGLEQEVGDASGAVMYKCGFQWGLADMRRFETLMSREHGQDIQAMNINFLMETWWWPLQTMDWGNWEIDFSYPFTALRSEPSRG